MNCFKNIIKTKKIESWKLPGLVCNCVKIISVLLLISTASQTGLFGIHYLKSLFCVAFLLPKTDLSVELLLNEMKPKNQFDLRMCPWFRINYKQYSIRSNLCKVFCNALTVSNVSDQIKVYRLLGMIHLLFKRMMKAYRQ